jgi:hypothetical protein
MPKVFTEYASTISIDPTHYTFMAAIEMGIDIVGPLTAAQGYYKYAVVAVEYFTKWIESKPLVIIAAAGLKRLFWHNIICRFEVPRKIIVDNAK